MTLFTIGHSSMSIEDFMHIMAAHKIEVLMDVRSHPGSNFCPQFNRASMMEECKARDYKYIWEPGLGGWSNSHLWAVPEMDAVGVNIRSYLGRDFPKQTIARKVKQPEGSPAWTNLGLYHYSWFMAMHEFLGSMDYLLSFKRTKVAIMCAELLWWKCHRSMIADYVVWKGRNITHLQPKLTSHKAVIGNRLERYDPRIIEAWRYHVTE
jgi:uncharacterized protein (DUF488 family)